MFLLQDAADDADDATVHDWRRGVHLLPRGRIRAPAGVGTGHGAGVCRRKGRGSVIHLTNLTWYM